MILLWTVHPLNNFEVLPNSATASKTANNIQITHLEGKLSDKDIAEINELAAEDMPIQWKALVFPRRQEELL